MKIRENSKRSVNVSVDAVTLRENVKMPYPRLSPSPIEFTFDPNLELRRPTVVEMKKREGGTYIYSNNPEVLAKEDVGCVLLETTELFGEVFFTYEHSNRTGADLYLGYRLVNDGNAPVTVKVKNIGFQTDGEWLGQRSWSDFYNMKLDLPADYFVDGRENVLYRGGDYVDYTPRVFEGTEIVLPPKKSVFILGGTTNDSFDGVNIDNTADRPIKNGCCSNAVVLFEVTNGTLKGQFCAYTEGSVPPTDAEGQGYVTKRNATDYSAQYKGVDRHHGVIDTFLTFAVNEKTKKGRLPVRYTNMRDPNFGEKKEPYSKYNMIEYCIADDKWLSSLNPNTNPRAIGTDMMTFECKSIDGETLIVDNDRADGSGKAANTGNWMVQYTDVFTLVNVGTSARTFKIYKKGATAGALLSIVRDENGDVLKKRLCVHPYSYSTPPKDVDLSLLIKVGNTYWYKVDGRPYYELTDEKALVCEVTVPERSAKTMSVEYLILGNSCGGIEHWIELE